MITSNKTSCINLSSILHIYRYVKGKTEYCIIINKNLFVYRCSCVQHAWIWRNHKNEWWKWEKKYEIYIVAKTNKRVSGRIQNMNNIAKTTLHIYQIRKNHNRKLLLLSLSQLDLKSHSFIILCEFAFSISSYCYYFLFRCSFIWLDEGILLLHFDWFMTGWMKSKFYTFLANLLEVLVYCRIY